MTDNVFLQRELLPNCTVAAVFKRIAQGMEWRAFLDNALKHSLITWGCSTGANEVVVGHSVSLSAFGKHISTHAPNSYELSNPVLVRRQPLISSGEATGKIKKQSSSADQFAIITIRAEPIPDSRTIQLNIPRSNKIPQELQHPSLSEAILEGICLASIGNDPGSPIVGFLVTVVDGKWHDVDSYPGVFKKATRMAMSDILADQSFT